MMRRQGDLAEIKKYGHLRVITTVDEKSDLEAELLKEFSADNKLDITWISVSEAQQAEQLLLAGQADVFLARDKINAGLISSLPFQTEKKGAVVWMLRDKTPQLKDALNHQLNRYFISRSMIPEFQEDLVGLKRRKLLRIATRPDLNNFFLKNGRPAGFEYELLRKFAKQEELRLHVIVSASDDEMVSWLREGKVDMIATEVVDHKDSELVSTSPYYLTDNSSLKKIIEYQQQELKLGQQRQWTMNSLHGDLISAINSFISDEYRSRFYNLTYNNYFSEDLLGNNFSQIISPYDHLVKKHAGLHEIDWRLIVAQMYQESQFSPDSISNAGAGGLMQIMPHTAAELGLKTPEDPELNIQAGVIYMKKLRDRFAGDVVLEDRQWFALAAYNAGFERIKDARRFAEKLDLDPDRWFGNVEHAMQKLAREENLTHTRFGPCNCGQTVIYVREIRNLFNSYIQLTDPVLTASVQENLLATGTVDNGLDQSLQQH
jgi:membrane-bound lytic murein transglycosylase MltF